MELSHIKPYSKNHKKHPKEQVYKIACSIRDFGWRQSIVVDNEGVIIAGHGRWLAWERYGKEMNLPEPRIDVASDLTAEQAHVYRLADNLLSSQEYDMDVVNAELSQIAITFEPYQAMLQFDAIGQTAKQDEPDEKKINEDGLLAYLNNTIRQVVLHYPQDEFVGVLEMAEKLQKQFSLETNSDLFKKLLTDATNNT